MPDETLEDKVLEIVKKIAGDFSPIIQGNVDDPNIKKVSLANYYGKDLRLIPQA